MTISEWQQAYADAQVLLNQAQSLVSNLEGQLDDMVAQAIASIPEYEYTLPVATDETLGGVKIGNGIGTLGDGTIFVQQQESSGSATPVNIRKYDRIADIVDYTIQAEYEDDELSVTTISASSLPVATMQSAGMVIPDGTSITIDDDGMIHAEAAYVPIATESSTGSVKPDGTTITIDQDGTIHGAAAYELPIATTETLGGVIPDGATITVGDDGTIAVDMFTEEEILELTPYGSLIPDGDEMSW